MPARIVIVHDEPNFTDSLSAALTSSGHDVATFMDPQVAWDALDEAKRVELLITRVNFPLGKPNGVSLARMVRYKRPGIRVVFTALSEFAEHTDGLGEFVPMRASVPDVMLAVTRLLESGAEDPRMRVAAVSPPRYRACQTEDRSKRTITWRAGRNGIPSGQKSGESHDRDTGGRG
jgi:DNA-binding NtrC family response regulator